MGNLFDFDKLPSMIAKEGLVYAEATSQWEYLEEMRKTELARISSNYEGSEAFKERMARKTPAYLAFCETVKNQRLNALKSKARLDALKCNFDYYRSINANRRAEMQFI